MIVYGVEVKKWHCEDAQYLLNESGDIGLFYKTVFDLLLSGF